MSTHLYVYTDQSQTHCHPSEYKHVRCNVAMYCNVAMFASVLSCAAVCCSTLQHVAACCSMLQHVAVILATGCCIHLHTHISLKYENKHQHIHPRYSRKQTQIYNYSQVCTNHPHNSSDTRFQKDQLIHIPESRTLYS